MAYLSTPDFSFAQNGNGSYDVYTTWNEFISEYTDYMNEYVLSDDEKNSDIEQDLDFLENLHRFPVNINNATKDDFLKLPFLTETQADSILSYRDKAHEFYSLGELQFVYVIKPIQRKWLSLFFYAEKAKRTSEQWMKGRSKHLAVTSFDFPLYKRAGNKTHSKEEIKKAPNSVYWGNGISNSIRYRYSRGKDFDTGITLQKDAGEPFASCKNYPYDYVSAYGHIVFPQRKLQIWIGDFDVRSNHGLLFSSGIFRNKAQINSQISPKALQIKGHTSCDEINYFRGFATNLQTSFWTITVLASIKKLDSRLNNDTVTSFSKTGLHRTKTEIERKNNVQDITSAFFLGYKRGCVQWGITSVYDHYDHIIWPIEKTYNKYYLRGRNAFSLSSNYGIVTKKWIHTGEIALDKKAHIAATHQTRYMPLSELSVTGQIRHFSPQFISVHGGTMQEGSTIQNETGITIGATYQISAPLELNVFADYFLFTRETFRASKKNSQGYSFNAMILYSKAQTTYKIRYRFKTKQQDIFGYKGTLQYVSSHRLTLSSIYNSPYHISMTFSTDVALSVSQRSNCKAGIMISSRFSWKGIRKTTFDAFAATFFTDGSKNRFYAYEPQLRFTGSFPSFSYHGMRIVAQCSWKPKPFLQISGRYGMLYYFNQNKIASGTQQINSPIKNDLSLQAILSF